jgi:hypothetical protein
MLVAPIAITVCGTFRTCRGALMSVVEGYSRSWTSGPSGQLLTQAVRKLAWAKDARNCFLNFLLPKEVAHTIDSHIDKIEIEILHVSWASEFSHSLDPERKSEQQSTGINLSSCLSARRTVVLEEKVDGCYKMTTAWQRLLFLTGARQPLEIDQEGARR